MQGLAEPLVAQSLSEVYIGSSHALVSLADSLNATGEFDPYSDANIGRSVLRLDVAMRDKAPDNDVVTSALLKVLDRVPGLQILVIRRQFGSFYSSIYQGDDGWDINVHKRILPRQVAVALVSSSLAQPPRRKQLLPVHLRIDRERKGNRSRGPYLRCPSENRPWDIQGGLFE